MNEPNFNKDPEIEPNNLPIDSVHILKVKVGLDDNRISIEQVNIILPEKNVNAKVVCTLSEMFIHCYCFY